MTTPLSPEYLAEIAARAEAATAGPWCTDGAEIYQGDEYSWDAFWVGETCRADEADGGLLDAAFIAHARTDVPALLAEVERLRAALSSAADAIAEQDDEIADWAAKNAALRAELAARPTRAEATASPVRTERSRWQAVADALNEIDVAGIDLDGTIAGHNAWSVVRDRDAGWMVSGYDAEAGESR
ncbi:hypothetical protein [Streptomyces diastaticus]|uniref:hypothetical protein n=1 Tax=Streptomyces diastaticus TaxID=1956 RepID=UPI00365E5C22